MSDLESTVARGTAAAPVRRDAPASHDALGKLRALGARDRISTRQDGLVDAFVEVFAQIAASRPIPSDYAVPEDDPSPTVDDPSPTIDDGFPQDSQKQRDDVQEVQPIESSDGPQRMQTTTESNDLGLEFEPVKSTDQYEADQHEFGLIKPEQEPVVDEEQRQLQIAPADVEDTVQQSQIDVAETVAPEAIERQEGKRDRRQNASSDVKPVVGPRQEQTHEDAFQIESLPRVLTGDDDGPQIEPLHDQNPQDHVESSPSASRRIHGRRRHDQGIEVPQQAVSQSKQAEANRLAENLSAGQTTADAALSPEPASDTSHARPTHNRVSAAIINVQSLAGNLAKHAASANGQATSANPRLTTQMIEGTHSIKDSIRPKPDASKTNSRTAQTVSRVKLIQRVSKAFQHLGPEGGMVRLRLAPAELGSVRVEMRILQRKVQARVIAETEAASSLLREHLPDLRQRLESQGMQIERIEIESDQTHSELSDRYGRRQDDHPGHQSRRHGRSYAGHTEPANKPVKAERVSHPNLTGGIDVRL